MISMKKITKIILLIIVNLCFVMNMQGQTECNFSPGTIGAASETICYNGNPALIASSETNNAIALFNVNEALFGIHNDIIALPTDVWFTGNYTIESWVKPQKVQMYIFANGASYENRMIGNVFESFAGGQDFVSFAYGDENTYTPKLRVGGSNGTSSITSSIAIPENQWSHLAVTFNGTTATMYINGQVVATGPMAVPTSVLRTYNRIGNGRSIGQFDEVRIWNIYRTAEEIMTTMNVPLSGSETGLKAYYDCNQGTAYVNNASITTLIDKSPNNKNATLSNFYMVEDQSNFVNGSPATINASGGSGTFTYKWQANGVDIVNSNSASYDPPAGLTTTTTYTRFAEDETCNTFKQSLGSYVVTVRENFLSGEISSAGESICNNGDPTEIGSTTAASGGDGAITYKWQANGVDIANSNSATFDPPTGLTATTTYTRFAKQETCNTIFTPSTGIYVVTVIENFSAGEISSSGESICNNGDPAVISSTAAASGGIGAITYKWQANGVDIENSDSDSYDPPSGLTATTTYIRFAEDQTCNTIQQSIGSYVVTLTDLPASVNIIADNAVYPNPITFTANAVNGGTSPTYQWYNGTTAVGTNSATYKTATLTLGQSLAIKVVMTSSATPCLTGSPATSNTINIASPIVPSVRLVSAGIGVASTAMNPSAQLEVKSDTKGFLPPRMTATERDAIASPVAGLILYCSNCGANGELEVYNGATWTNLGGSAAAAIVGSATATSIVSDPTNFNIKTNTVVAVDQLDITPSADFSLNTGITRNTTATNSITNPAISRYYKFGATTNAFSGILKINYDETELNGLTENNLKLLYHNGTIWNSDVNSSNNATNNFVQSSSLSSVALNEVTTGIGEIPTGPLSFCAGAKVAAAVGNTSLKFYNGLTGGSPLAGTTALTTKTYYVTETINNGVSDPRVPVAIIVNALPATPTLLVLTNVNSATPATEIKAVGVYVGAEAALKLTATAVGATSYVWTLPAGVTLADGITTGTVTTELNTIDVKFSASAATSSLIVSVKSVNASGCSSSLAKTLTLTRAIPVAPAYLKMNNGLNITAITSFAKYMGTGTVLRLTAAASATATSYVWELPEGANRVTGLNDYSVINSLESTLPEIFVTLTGVNSGNTHNYSTSAGVSTNVLRIGVYGKNGTGLSSTVNATLANPATTSTARLLTLTAVKPAAPATLKMFDLNSLTPATAVTAITTYVNTESELKLEAKASALASSYTWYLQEGVNVTNNTATAVEGAVNTYKSTSNAITVNFYGVPHEQEAFSLVLGVKAVNGIGESVSTNTGTNALRTDKLLTLTAVLPTVPGTVSGSLKICATTASSVTYTIASVAAKARDYFIEAPQGCTITSLYPDGNVYTSTGEFSGTPAVANASFKVNYPAGFIANTTTDVKTITIRSVNYVGPSATAKVLTLTNTGAVCTPAPGRIAPEATTADKFSAVAYPNPATEGFRVKSSNGKSIGVQVYDMLGRSIEQRQLQSEDQIGSNYAKGIYNVIVSQGTEVKTLRVIKE